MKKSTKRFVKASVVASASLAGIGVAMNQLVLTRASKKISDKMSEADSKKNPPNPDSQKCRLQSAGGQWLADAEKEHIVINNRSLKRIHAYMIRADKPTDKWVILVHGYTSAPEGMGDYGIEYAKMGYNILLPALRGHGINEEKYISMGWLDRLDMVDWIHYLLELDRDAQIVLHGVSMGSATVMMTTGEALPDNVKCCVADCGYTSVWDEFKNELKVTYHLPSFPFLYLANTATRVLAGYDFKTASSLEQLKKSKTPTIFIHGENDAFVPYRMLDRNFNAAACVKEKVSIPDAEHAESHLVHPELYWPEVWSFIGRYVKDTEK